MKKRVLSVILAFGIIFSNSSAPFATIAEDGTVADDASGDTVQDEQNPDDSGTPQEEPPSEGDDEEPQQPETIQLKVKASPQTVYKGQQERYWKDGKVSKDYLTFEGEQPDDALRDEIADSISVSITGDVCTFTPGPETFDYNGRTYAVTYELPEVTLATYQVDANLYTVDQDEVRVNDQNNFCISSDQNSFDPNTKKIDKNALTDKIFYLRNINENAPEYLAVSGPLTACRVEYFCKDDLITITDNDVNLQASNAIKHGISLQTSAILGERFDNVVLRLYYGDANADGTQDSIDFLGKIDEQHSSNDRVNYVFETQVDVKDGEAVYLKNLRAELLVNDNPVASKNNLRFKDNQNHQVDSFTLDKILPVIEKIYVNPDESKVYIVAYDEGSGLREDGHYGFVHWLAEKDPSGGPGNTLGHSKTGDPNEYCINFDDYGIKINGDFDVTVEFTDKAGNSISKNSREDFDVIVNVDTELPEFQDVEIHFGTKDADGKISWNETAAKSIAAYQYGIFSNRPMRIDVKVTDNQQVKYVRFASDGHGDMNFTKKTVTEIEEGVDAEGNPTSKEVTKTLDDWYSCVIDNGYYANARLKAKDGKKDNQEAEIRLSELLKSYYPTSVDNAKCQSNLYIETECASTRIDLPKNPRTNAGEVWFGIDQREDGKFKITVNDDMSGIASVEIRDNGTLMTKFSENFTSKEAVTNQHEIEIPLTEFSDYGKHVLTVTVKDNAGTLNTYTEEGEVHYSRQRIGESDATSGYTFYTDFEAPTGSLSFDEKSKAARVLLDDNSWFNGSSVSGDADLVGFVAAVAEDELHPYQIEYEIENSAHQKWSGTKTLIGTDGEVVPATFDETGASVSKDGEHWMKVSVTFVDRAGNKGEPVTLEYYKDTESPRINEVKVSKTEAAADKIIRILTFGIYSNYEILYTVDASDAANDSGLDKHAAQITFGTTNYSMDYKEENGKQLYTRVLSAKDENVLSGEVDVTVTDRYGLGKTEKIHYTKDFEIIQGSDSTKGNPNTKSKLYMIETNPPSVTFEPLVSDGQERTDGQVWFKDDHDILFTATDADSGISSVKVYVNGSEPYVEDSDKKAFLTEEFTNGIEKVDDVYKEEAYRLSTDGLIASLEGKLPEDGHYVIKVEVADYAGNTAEGQVDYYIDKQAPNVENISFSLASADGYNNTDEPEGEQFIEYLEYGYYFKEAFKATVHVTDPAPSSGLYEVKYTFIPYQNGEMGEAYDGFARINENGDATFDVAKDYKGQIMVQAFDYVGNESEERTPHAFVVDSMDVHESETHIEISGMDGTGFKDQSQHPLYDKDVNLTVKIIYKQSGIREIKYSMKSELENQDEKVITIPNTGISNDQDLGDGWRVTAMDANLVTEVTRDYHFGSDNNDMQLLFSMTDRANNTSSKESDVFSIDKTAPVIDVVFAPTPGSGTYYREARTAKVTVTERNFDASRIKAIIGAEGGTAPALSFKDNSNTEHVAELTFLEGDYTFSMEGSDLCDHAASVKYSGGNEQKFTVDLTDPIETDNFDQFKNDRDNSFNLSKEMTFTVTEHNFVPEAVNIRIYRVPAGQEFTASGRTDCTQEYLSKSKWTGTGDVHTISFTFADDYVYQVSISAADASGRTLAEKTSPVFEIDKTAPVLKTPEDLQKIAYTAKDKDASAKPIQFEDKNLAGVKYTVVSYRMKRNEDKVGYDMDINSKQHDVKTDSVVLDKDYFAQDGIYEVMCTAYDVAGNASKKSTHTFIIQRDTDFLVYIPESDKEAHTGLYEFNERGVRSAEFKDINIVAYLAKDKNFEVQVDGTAVAEPDIETEVQDELINQVNVYDVTLKNSFISNKYSSEEIDTDLMLNAVATGEGKEQVITLGHIYIDNVKPAGEYEASLQNLGFFDGFYGMDSRTATLEGVSPDIDVEKCEILLNNATLRSDDGGFTYDENAHTITFRLNRGYNDIRPTLVDMAGNVNTLDVVKNVYVGGVFARWWYLFILGGLVVAAIPTVIIIMAIRRKKYSM
ncbi:MAG: hypothetical protein IKN55_00190 [Oscillospiraceae bacterium]|nr:hypothetical protein [Oscillospiraceae bacterium]